MITIREGDITNVDWWRLKIYAEKNNTTRGEVISQLVTKFVDVKCADIPKDPAFLPKSSGSFNKGENSIIRKRRNADGEEHVAAGDNDS